jgi:hypothetical protein
MPRLLYDPITQRWFAWVQGINPQNGYLAVSATSDPTGPWKGVKMPIPPHNYGARIGFDKNGLYISVHNGNDNLHKAQTCYAIPMADVVAADGPNLSHMQSTPRFGNRSLSRHGSGSRETAGRTGCSVEP